MIKRLFLPLLLLLAAIPLQAKDKLPLGRFDHIIVVVMENLGYTAIIGDTTDCPYINKTLIPQGVLFTNSHGVTHPSQGNYVALFSGSQQTVKDDACAYGPYSAPNLYSALTAKGKTMTGYFESLDVAGNRKCSVGSANGIPHTYSDTVGQYVGKHNPLRLFSNVPVTAWQPYKGPLSSYPSLAFVVPNIPHDMHVFDSHTSTPAEQKKQGDTWLSLNLPSMISYAKANRGLVIVTMDEGDDNPALNQVPTIAVGAGVAAGLNVSASVNHYGVCRYILENFGAPLFANASTSASLALP